MTEKKYVTVSVVSQEKYDSGPFNFGGECTDGTLNAVIFSLCAIRDSIPLEYRDAARCEIDSESGYEGSHYASIKVTYKRPETPEDQATRLAAEDARKRQQEAKERAEFERLKAKFERQ